MSNSVDNCLTDTLLLRTLDEELPRRQVWLAKLHLESCESCQARLEGLRLVSSRVSDLHQAALPSDLDCEFAARLEQEDSRKNDWAWRPWFARPLLRQFAWCAAIVIVILAGLRVWTNHPGVPARQVVRPLLPAVAALDSRQLAAETPGQPVHRTRHIARKHLPREQLSSPARGAVREVATPFFDLPFSDAALPLDQATMIRVELPRSALELTGLPVDEERRNQRIRADLVLGADGLARAIRFIE